LGDLGIDGRIILKSVLKSSVWRGGLDLSGSGWSSVVDTYEHSNEPLGSIKHGEFLLLAEWLSYIFCYVVFISESILKLVMNFPFCPIDVWNGSACFVDVPLKGGYVALLISNCLNNKL